MSSGLVFVHVCVTSRKGSTVSWRLIDNVHVTQLKQQSSTGQTSFSLLSLNESQRPLCTGRFSELCLRNCMKRQRPLRHCSAGSLCDVAKAQLRANNVSAISQTDLTESSRNAAATCETAHAKTWNHADPPKRFESKAQTQGPVKKRKRERPRRA
jgi:hypothetical protein